MIGPIRGTRLSAEVKHRLLEAVQGAKRQGFTLERACATIELDPRRARRWAKRREGSAGVSSSSSAPAAPGQSEGLIDRPPIASRRPHALTAKERAQILATAAEESLAHLRHRKLTHHLSREGRVFCSESSTLRILREAGKVPAYERRRRPVRPRPQMDASEPNRA